MMDKDALRAWMARHAGQITGDKKWQGLWDRVQRFSSTAAIIEDQSLSVNDSAMFGENYGHSCELLESHRMLSFGQSILHAADALEVNHVRTNVHEVLRFLLVDEYQDINSAQERLIRGLVGPNTQLTVVDDDDQSIYQWRGADVQNMVEFPQRYESVHDVVLRGRQEIVESGRGSAFSGIPAARLGGIACGDERI